MSLYNTMFGFEPTAPVVLAVLRIEPAHIDRFRDAYFTWDATQQEPIMVILARTGTTSWTEPEHRNAHLLLHSDFIDAGDDEYDTSFALYRFAVPVELRELIHGYLKEHGPPLSIREKVAQITGPDQTRKQKAALDAAAEQLRKVIEDSHD